MAKDQKQVELKIGDVVGKERPIHPALDWVSKRLIVGVNLKHDKRAVLSSTDSLQGLGWLDKFGHICARSTDFQSAVSPECAIRLDTFLKNRQVERVNAHLSRA